LSELRKRGSKVPAIMITATTTPPLQRRGSEWTCCVLAERH
jgi:hypothetical protein